MATAAQKARLGAFLFIAFLLFVGGMTALVGSQFWKEEAIYDVRYRESVSGLEKGAAVKLNGVWVGTVRDVLVDPDDVGVVIVQLTIEPRTPIKADMVAVPVGQGITGLKFIELRGGTRAAATLQPGDEIQSGVSEFDVITGKAEDIALKVEQLANNLLAVTDIEQRSRIKDVLEKASVALDDVHTLSGEATTLAQGMNEIVGANKGDARRLVRNFTRVGEQLSQTSQRLDEVLVAQTFNMESTFVSAQRAFGAIEKTASELELDATLREFDRLIASLRGKVDAANIDGTLRSVRRSLISLRVLLENLNTTALQVGDDLRATTANLRASSENLRDFTRSIREDPSRLLTTQERPRRKMR